MNINRLLSITIICTISIISCKNDSQSLSSNDENTQIDTITTSTQNGTTIKVVKLYLDEIESYSDTTFIIDAYTLEEKVEIVEHRGPRQEIISMDYIPR